MKTNREHHLPFLKYRRDLKYEKKIKTRERRRLNICMYIDVEKKARVFCCASTNTYSNATKTKDRE